MAADPGDRDALHDLMRGFHGFAGSGTTYGFPGVTALGREGEASCSAALKGAAALSSAHFDRWRGLWARLDRELVAAGDPPVPAGAATAPAAPAARGDVLVVDDDEALARLLSHLLEQEGLSVRRAATKAEALRAVGERMPGGCIVDIRFRVRRPRLDALPTSCTPLQSRPKTSRRL